MCPKTDEIYYNDVISMIKEQKNRIRVNKQRKRRHLEGESPLKKKTFRGF